MAKEEPVDVLEPIYMWHVIIHEGKRTKVYSITQGAINRIDEASARSYTNMMDIKTLKALSDIADERNKAIQFYTQDIIINGLQEEILRLIKDKEIHTLHWIRGRIPHYHAVWQLLDIALERLERHSIIERLPRQMIRWKSSGIATQFSQTLKEGNKNIERKGEPLFD